MPNLAQIPKPRVLLVRSSGNEADADALAAVGVATVSDPYISVATRSDIEASDDATALLSHLAQAQWVIATSSNGVAAWGELVGAALLSNAFADAAARGVRFAAIGEATAKKYSEFGIHDCLVASEAYAETLAAEVLAVSAAPAIAVVPLGSIALPTLGRELTAAGWTVHTAALYQTITVTAEPVTSAALNAGEFSAVLLRSPSAARAVAHWANDPGEVKAICSGQTTAAAASDAGLNVVAIGSSPQPADFARIVSEALGGAN